MIASAGEARSLLGGGDGRTGRNRALEHALFGLIPVLITVVVVYHVISTGIGAVDFTGAYRVAGLHVLHAISPYRWPHTAVVGAEVFVYPAPAALFFVPFGLLSSSAGAVIFTIICLASAIGVLRLLDVHDWRCYGVIFALPWVVTGWQTGNLTLLLALGLALVWRKRDQPLVAGLVSAILISLKPFMLPVALWLLATRRYRAAAWCLASGLILNVLAWSLVGFGEIKRYLDLSSQVTQALERTGYGAISLAAHVGIPSGAAVAAEAVAAIAVAGACVREGRRREDRRSLTWAILLMLIAWPLVWSHYFALLLIPVAIARPRLGMAWLLPLALWVCAVRTTVAWQIVLSWAVVIAILVDTLRSSAETANGLSSPGLGWTGLRRHRLESHRAHPHSPS